MWFTVIARLFVLYGLALLSVLPLSCRTAREQLDAWPSVATTKVDGGLPDILRDHTLSRWFDALTVRLPSHY